MLLPRILTAIVGIPLVILSIYWGGIPFFILMSGVVLFSLREFFFISRRAAYNPHSALGVVLGYLFFVAIFLSSVSFSQKADHQLVPMTLTFILFCLTLVELVKRTPGRSIERLGITFFGVFFIPWAFAHLTRIYYLRPAGSKWVFFLFLIIWTLDTSAYFFGIKFGKNRLAESISPKKSVEGLVAAVVSAVIIAPLLGRLLLRNYVGTGESMALGFFIALIGQFSDLAESLIKRDAEIKDSDTLLPGHGGMLDRFDAFLFTAPILYYYIIFFK